MTEWSPPPVRTELIWAGVDFDNTLARSEPPDYMPGYPIEENVAKLNELRDAGYKIAIHTARGWEFYELVESYLNHYGIHFDRIICGKLLAALYCDDKAVPAQRESWLPVEDDK